MTDPLRLFPQIVGTFSPDEAILQIQHIEEEHGLEAIVVGWPVEEDGSEGKAVKRTEPFFNRLRKLFRSCEILKQDERYSSRRAAAALAEAGVKKKDRRAKGRLDTAAAVLILQDFLDERDRSVPSNS